MVRIQYYFRAVTRLLVLSLLVLATWSEGYAQSTTATIRGTVTNESGAPLANAEVNAVSTTSGFTRTVKAGRDGSFVLNGLTPGSYSIVTAAEGFEPRSQDLTVSVGQNLTVDFRMSPQMVVRENITVVGNQAVETRTSEIATNVSTHQIENLPQNDRNFLNFAQLAPGVSLSKDPQRKTISSGAQPAEQTNVFIDGVSMKNDVLQGGVAGQDASRGNPFPQNAVQEFRVITQNYSAQYDKASSAIITAVTKSGGNQYDGQAFVFYQPKAWVEDTEKGFQFSTLTTNQDYSRYQSGINLGGPIMRDKLNFFVAYEGDNEHATTPVTLGNSAFAGQFGQFTGVFGSPFKSNLAFGKLSLQAASNQLLDFSINYRKEHETRDFGGQTSFQSATDLRNSVNGATLRHQWNNSNSLNQATLSLQKYYWNPTPLNPDLVGLNYQGIIRIGGNSTTQKFGQRRLELRDDYTFGNFNWLGTHSLQVGGNLDDLHYDVNKSLNGNPEFQFRTDPANGLTLDQPFEVSYGFGNPKLSIGNKEYGIYGQDTWSINPKFTANIGLRWDYESHMLDESYVTPANIVAGLTGKVSSDYFSDGNSRKPTKDNFQPRLGFSYDLRGDSKSVVFGGAGRYYDRLFLNATLDERYRLQFPVYRIEFSPTGAPRNGGPTIKWDPKYLSKAGLDQLIASGATNPEIYLLNNNTKTPYSDQWNVGFRQALGSWLGSLSYNQVKGRHIFTWLSASGLCCAALVPGFGNVIISDPEGKSTNYKGIFLSLDRPYTSQGALPWGAHLAWTHGKATQNGNDLFSLDYPSAAQYPTHEVPGTERDRIVATGTFGLPYDVRFGTIVSLGSGGATNVLDFSQGFSLQNRLATQPFKRSIYPERTWGFADRSVDLRLEKDFKIMGGASIGLIAEGFNVFNWTNFGCLNNFIPPEGNPSLGQPGCVVGLGRRLQAGLRVGF